MSTVNKESIEKAKAAGKAAAAKLRADTDTSAPRPRGRQPGITAEVMENRRMLRNSALNMAIEHCAVNTAGSSESISVDHSIQAVTKTASAFYDFLWDGKVASGRQPRGSAKTTTATPAKATRKPRASKVA
jgi:hypothetical protein